MRGLKVGPTFSDGGEGMSLIPSRCGVSRRVQSSWKFQIAR